MAKHKPMTPTQIYRKAAELVDSGEEEFSCLAVAESSPPGESYLSDPLCRDYMKAFRPWLVSRYKDGRDRKQIRVLMLLFMSVAWRDLR